MEASTISTTSVAQRVRVVVFYIKPRLAWLHSPNFIISVAVVIVLYSIAQTAGGSRAASSFATSTKWHSGAAVYGRHRSNCLRQGHWRIRVLLLRLQAASMLVGVLKSA